MPGYSSRVMAITEGHAAVSFISCYPLLVSLDLELQCHMLKYV